MRNLGLILSGMAAFSMAACSSAPKQEASQPTAAPAAMSTPYTYQAPYGKGKARNPADIDNRGNGNYFVSWCSPKGGGDSGKKWNIENTRNGNKVGGRLDNDGCMTFTFKAGGVNDLNPGDNLHYYVDGDRKASETVPGGNGGSSGGGGGQTGGTDPRPPPRLPDYDLDKARNAANNHARCTANAIVAMYGRMENYRYNFYRGFREGIYLYDFSNGGNVANSPEFQQGFGVGRQEGSMRGGPAGTSQAQSDASAQARGDVRARYTEIVDRGTPPNLTVSPPAITFPGLTSQAGSLMTLEARIGSYEDDYRRSMLSMSFSSDDDSFVWGDWRSEWNLGSMYRWNSYQNDLVRGWYRDDWAYELFRQGRFRRCSNESDYYDNTLSPSKYSNYQEARNTYRNRFKSVYDNVIDEKWNNTVTQSNSRAKDDGFVRGVRIAREQAHDIGYNQGFGNAYAEASRESYRLSYTGFYTEAFNSEVQVYERNVIPVLHEAQVVDGNKTRNGLVVGAPVGVSITRAMNLGRQRGEATVSMTGVGIDNVVNKTLTMEPSSSVKGNPMLIPMGIVSANVEPNKQVGISIRMGNQVVNDSFTMEWGKLILNYASSTAESKRIQTDYLVRWMSKEIDDGYGGVANFTNDWENPAKNPTLLTTAVDTAQRNLTPEQRRAFKPVADALNKKLGSEPDCWVCLDATAGEFKALKNLFRKLSE